MSGVYEGRMSYLLKVALLSVLYLSSVAATAAGIDIFDAARQGDVPAIAAYAQQGGGVDVVNRSAYTPFILATYHGHDDAAKTLIEAGADACAVDEKGSNAYMGVAFKGFTHTAQWLLDNTT